jgi:hypothetical protein
MNQQQRKRRSMRDRAAGQEADRAQAALRNTREGYGDDRSTHDIDRKPGEAPDTAEEVAREHGEREG